MTSIHDSDPRERKTAWIFAAAVVGALVPPFWIAMGFLLFNMPQSHASDLFWDAVYITCPSWLLPGWSVLRMCLLNALLYGLIAFLVVAILRKRRPTRPST
jgi:hypothetical protein